MLLDAIAAAIAYEIKVDRIRQWASRGKLQPAGRRGRFVLYDTTHIESLLDRHGA